MGMPFKALLITSILGVSSVAMAHPRDRYSAEFRPTYSQRYHQTYSDRPYGYQVDATPYGYGVGTYAYGANPDQANIARDEWMLVADNVSLGYQPSTTIPLGNRHLDAIELQATRGGSFIEQVLVDLDDGRRLTITPQRPLDVVHAPNLRIDLGRGTGCGIRAVTIVGQSRGYSTFRVIAG